MSTAPNIKLVTGSKTSIFMLITGDDQKYIAFVNKKLSEQFKMSD